MYKLENLKKKKKDNYLTTLAIKIYTVYMAKKVFSYQRVITSPGLYLMMFLLLCFLFNVVACKCDPGGSVNMNCFKHSGDCSCVTGVRGKKCDRYK